MNLEWNTIKKYLKYISLFKKTINKFFKDLKLSDVSSNEKFWKTVKPLYRNKTKGKSQIALV